MNYYNEVENYVKKVEIGKAIRKTAANNELVDAYWNVGKLIVEAQGGKEKAKYGNELIKKWAERLTSEYGKGYNYTNLSRFRQFYLSFPILAPVGQELNWTIIRTILPIKDENKRNYYINLCIEHNLSKRELEKEIKNNSYERLLNKPDKINIIVPKVTTPTIVDGLKNPVMLNLNGRVVENEKDLEKLIYSQLNYVFMQLGKGFMWVGNQYKITENNRSEFIDMLLYNINYNCYVVVELKIRKLKKQDKAQVESYMDLVDRLVKAPNVNNTIGIIISKDQDKFVANFVRSNKIVPLNYKLVN